MALCLGLLASSLAGCGRKPRKPSLRERAESIKEQAAKEDRVFDTRVGTGSFTVRDGAGRPLIEANADSWETAVSAARGLEGPVTLRQVSCRLFREGKPVLWLKTPQATWEAGLLKAANGVRSGSVDGRMRCEGASASWAAKPNLLTVRELRTDAHEAGRPALHAEGRVGTWQDGLLRMPDGVRARSGDGARTLRARTLAWRAATAQLVATGDVLLTGEQARMTGETLTADTRLRRVRMSGANPKTITRGGLGRRHTATSWVLASRGASATKAAPAGRSRVDLGEWEAEADSIVQVPFGSPESDFDMTGRVIIKGPRGTLTAARITGKTARRVGVASAHATGGVRMESTSEKDGRTMVARGQEATYDGRQDRLVLTGDPDVTITSSQLAEPAKLTGARIEAQLRARTATAYRTAAAPVQATLRRKGETEPLVLTADQIAYDSATDRVTATGKPLVRHPRGTLSADRLWSDLAGTAENPMVVRAEGNVSLDARGEGPDAETIQARGQKASYLRAEQRLILEGNVEGSVTAPDEPKPRRFSGDRMTYDLETKRLSLDGSPAQARVTTKRRK